MKEQGKKKGSGIAKGANAVIGCETLVFPKAAGSIEWQ